MSSYLCQNLVFSCVCRAFFLFACLCYSFILNKKKENRGHILYSFPYVKCAVLIKKISKPIRHFFFSFQIIIVWLFVHWFVIRCIHSFAAYVMNCTNKCNVLDRQERKKKCANLIHNGRWQCDDYNDDDDDDYVQLICKSTSISISCRCDFHLSIWCDSILFN